MSQHILFIIEQIFEAGFLTIYAIIVLFSLAVMISENRDPIRSLARMVTIIFVPILGVLLFYVFGRGHRGKEKIPEFYTKEMKQVLKQLHIKDTAEHVHKGYQPLVRLLKNHPNAWIREGSDIEIITSGERKFGQLLEDIQQAQHHIHMEYFRFDNDAIGTKVKEALMQKAEEGIEVRFLYDNAANWMIPASFYREMNTAGVKVSPFFKGIFKGRQSTINYRNHRKVVVIDGKIGYMGGMNVGDEYHSSPTRRDTHMRIQGEGVYGLQASFLLDWINSGEKDIQHFEEYFPKCKHYSNNRIQIVPRGNYAQRNSILQATTNILNNAKEYCYIQTPYFLPNTEITHALCVAGLSGIDVRIMIPKKTDASYVDPAAHSYYEEVMKAGVRIFEYLPGFIHAKTLVVDDYLSSVGSVNMDFRSFEHHFEINSYLYDEVLAKENKKLFEEDWKQCKEIDLKEWKTRPWRKKFSESIMRLFAPLM